MSRIFIFLLGALLGAFGVYVLYQQGIAVAPHAVAIPAPTSTLPLPEMPPVNAGTLPLGAGPALSQPPVVPVVAPPASPGPVSTDALPMADNASVVAPAPTQVLPSAASSAATAGLLLPVSGIKASQLVDTYTQARSGGRSHDAIDIMAPRGTPVLAVADGRVAKLFDSKQGGLTVYQFDTSEAVAYYYAHLDSYAAGVVEGKQLKRGDLVGYVGSTGNASPDGPHLHFAIFMLGPEKNWWQGTAINPYPLLGGRPHPGG
jgi:murein DD-endopeptidase MepM/ murein hydrolase activator NlpD